MRSRRRGAGLGKAEPPRQQQGERVSLAGACSSAPAARGGPPILGPRPLHITAPPASGHGLWHPLKVVHGHGHDQRPSPWAMEQQVGAADLGKGRRACPGDQQRMYVWGPAQHCRKHWVGRQAEGRVGRRMGGPSGPDLRGLALTSPSSGRTESWEPPAAPKAGRHTKLPALSLGPLPACLCREDRPQLPKCVRGAGHRGSPSSPCP